jgi:inhibitor of cysteine peptidase
VLSHFKEGNANNKIGGKNMKKSIIFILLTVFSGFVLSACDGPNGCDSTKTITLTQENSGETIHINPDDTIKVVLSSNPTTGFQWVNMLAEEGIIVQAGDSTYEQNPECAGMEGCGGTETFYFEAIQSGEGAIMLSYMQTWANNPIEEFAVTVVVD